MMTMIASVATDIACAALQCRFPRRLPGRENATMQSAALESQWNDLSAVSACVCAGGVVFEFLDEWWKAEVPAASLPAGGECPARQEDRASLHAVCGWRATQPDDAWDGFYSEGK